MARGPSDRALREMHRLFNVGTVRTLSDAPLLDRCVAKQGLVASMAFGELVVRHRPVVLRVCRSVRGDAHNAEDASQAMFLVLANRAGSIRRRRSIASWAVWSRAARGGVSARSMAPR
jgi:RNA polymerase sigma-70 factor (ECF subfamily)